MVQPATVQSSASTSPQYEFHGQESGVGEKLEARQPSSQERSIPATDEWEYVTGFKLYLVVAAVAIVAFLMLLDVSIVATAVPKITNDFHSLNDIGWYGTAYTLANAACQPLSGKIYNQFSSKYTFLVFFAIFELGSLLCATSVSSNMLIVGRAVSGIGGSGLMNGGLTIVRACVPLDKNPAYVGFLLGISQLGVLSGPLIGGALTEYVSWRWCFYINLPVGGAAIFAIFFIGIPDRRPKSEIKIGATAILDSFDLPGFAIFAGTVIMFLFAVSWGGIKYEWNSATIIGLFCGSAVTLVLFLGWEHRRGDTAMMPLSLLSQRVIWTSCVTYFFLCANMVATNFYMPIYFQAVRGKSPVVSGVYLLPAVLSQLALAIIAGIMVTRLGYYLPWIVVGGAIASIGTGLLTTLNPNSSTAKWVLYQMIAAIGRGCGLQMPIVAVQNYCTEEQVSIGVSAVMFAQGFGPALFLSFAQTIFSNSLKHEIPHYAPEVDVQSVINAGATGFREIVAPASLRGVIDAYNKSGNDVFYLITAAAVAVFVFGWGMGWKSVKKTKGEKGEASDVAEV